MRLKYDKIVNYYQHGELCPLCNNTMVDNYHEISCNRNGYMKTWRHDQIVKALLNAINNDKNPRPVARKNDNVPDDRKLVDIECNIDGKKWGIDVQFSKPGLEWQKFEGKKNKYENDYGQNVLPFIVGYSGYIWNESKKMMKKYLPEIEEEYIYKEIITTIVRANYRARQEYTEKIKNGINEERITRVRPFKSRN